MGFKVKSLHAKTDSELTDRINIFLDLEKCEVLDIKFNSIYIGEDEEFKRNFQHFAMIIYK